MITHCMVGRSTYLRAFYFARELVKLGHHVTIIATSPTERIKLVTTCIDGVLVVESPNLFSGPWRTGWDPWDIICRINYLQNHRYDIIHAFESRPAVIYPALYSKGINKVPLLFDWADWFGKGGSVEERSNPLLRLFLRPVETYYEEHFRQDSDGISVICSALHEKAVQLGISPQNIISLPNGCDTARFFPIKGKKNRTKYHIPSQSFTIGYIGAIFKRDAQLLCQAFSQLEKSNPTVRLVLIGTSGKNIKRVTPELLNVIDLGYVPDNVINDCMSICDIYWFPFNNTKANQGRWPLKFSDIIAVGKPIVSTDVGDTADVIRTEGIGCVTETSAEGLLHSTQELIHSKSKILIMGSKARHIAETKFQWEVIAARLSNWYALMIEKNR
ncbi:MAG: glycosyltransferase family 4 protein [Anaerolineaceae bacterium]|nr:glycosyltransferase family 4 protein [Anaerolineaceae bacterium]MBN2676570.1 glycosyltransferase family 4 protein [Anaerolineaceae bacterium]